jgi:hypothetical protein
MAMVTLGIPGDGKEKREETRMTTAKVYRKWPSCSRFVVEAIVGELSAWKLHRQQRTDESFNFRPFGISKRGGKAAKMYIQGAQEGF